MDFTLLSDFRKYAVLILLVSIVAGCSSSSNVQDSATQPTNPAEEIPSLQQAEEEAGGEETGESTPIIVTYRNASSNIQVSLDPDRDQFYVDLRGITPTERDSVVVIDSTIVKNRESDIQTLLSSYRKAQDLFYLGEYREALEEVDKTLEIQETADAYALKGTIFFMMENPTAARANWNRAVQMDPNIPVPSIPELEILINEIREDGGQ